MQKKKLAAVDSIVKKDLVREWAAFFPVHSACIPAEAVTLSKSRGTDKAVVTSVGAEATGEAVSSGKVVEGASCDSYKSLRAQAGLNYVGARNFYNHEITAQTVQLFSDPNDETRVVANDPVNLFNEKAKMAYYPSFAGVGDCE